TLWLLPSEMEHMPVPEHAPDQPAKLAPDAAAALNVTTDPLVNDAEQFAVQLTPAGDEVTRPLPEIAVESVYVAVVRVATGDPDPPMPSRAPMATSVALVPRTTRSYMIELGWPKGAW